MTRMPDFFAEVEHDAAAVGRGITSLFRQQHPRPGDRPQPQPRFIPHHQTSAAQPVATATIEPAPQEEPVSLSQDLHNAAAKLETIGEDGVEVLTAVKANPATAAGLQLLHELTGFNVSPDFITLGLSVLTELRDRLAAADRQPEQPQASFTPAGPQVAGQA